MRLPRFVFWAVAIAGIGAGCASQSPIGLIGSDAGRTITAFDPDANILQGSVVVPSRGDRDAYALAIDPSGARAYVSNRFGLIRRVALDGSTPLLSGVPITPSHTASALAMMSTGPRMLVAVGTDTVSAAGVLSTIDPETGAERDRISLGETTPYTIAACDDGRTVLVGTDAPQAVHAFTVDDGGRLDQEDATLTTPHSIANVYCAPGSQSGVVVFSADATMQSFRIGSMTGIATRRLAARSAAPVRSQPLGLSGVFSPDGTRFFVRSERGDFTGTGFVEAFPFDAATGALDPATQRTSVAPFAAASRGTHQVAISADGSRLYVTDTREDRVLVLDAATLSAVGTMGGIDLDGPFGIVVGAND